MSSTNLLSIAVSADDGYAMPMAVAVQSILDTLDPRYQIDLYILDGGISLTNRERCQSTWECRARNIHWIQPLRELFRNFSSSDHFTIATYFRLLLDRLLPLDVSRVVYVDPDTLCRKSIHEIANINLNGFPIAATQDIFCPFIDSRFAMPNFDIARGNIYGMPAIPNAVEQGVPVNQPYFNSGLMVMDLDCFRQRGIAERLLSYAAKYKGRLLWADQCALNGCLGDQWTQLDPIWNVTTPTFNLPSFQYSCFDQRTFERMVSDPALIHFAGPKKPWHYASQVGFVHEFFLAIDGTAWKGWRPDAAAEELLQNANRSKMRWYKRFFTSRGGDRAA